jgi:hypothetical protein
MIFRFQGMTSQSGSRRCGDIMSHTPPPLRYASAALYSVLQLQLPFPVRAKLDEKGNGKRDHIPLIPVSMPKR